MKKQLKYIFIIQGFVISFWIHYPASLTINTDADTTDNTLDVILIEKLTSSNIFKILTNNSNNIKVLINNQVYTATKSLSTNAWS